jgi:hypothetical protein
VAVKVGPVTFLYAHLDALPHQRRALVRLSGPDTVRFLQGTVTSDLEEATPGFARASALLTVKGKILHELVILRVDPQTVDLLVVESEASDVVALLEKYIIMDEVEVSPPASISTFVAWNPTGPEPQMPTGRVRSFSARHPAPQRLVLGQENYCRAVLAQGQEVDENGWNLHRVTTASPAWGYELSPNYFPPEVGFVHAVSYDKGCFLGQEPLARIHARGQVNRVLVRVKIDGEPPSLDLSHPDRADAGRLTTVARDGDAVVGLAIVRRGFAAPATVLTTAEGDVPVRVVSPPLGDDPGVASRSRAITVKINTRG